MIRNVNRWIGVIAAFSVAAGAALAGPFEDAKARFGQQDYPGALQLLQQAQQQDPNNPLIYAALGNTYRRLNDPADALNAYNRFLQIDPNLKSIPQKDAFAQAYQSVGGDPARLSAPATDSSPDAEPGASPADLINALASAGVYVAPSLRGQVDEQALQAAVERAAPRVVKIAVVAHTAGYPSRAALADDLRQRLNVPNDGVVLVATPKGISGSSATLTHEQIDEAMRAAGVDQAFARGGLTAALVQTTDSLTGSVATVERKSSDVKTGFAFALIGLIVTVVFGSALKRRRAMSAVRAPVEALRQQAIAGLSYVDGYLDLLPKGADADLAKRQRAAAYEAYATANGIVKVAKTPEQMRRAEPLLRQALDELGGCRAAIDRATGGTGVAMSVPETPSLLTDEQKGRAYLKNGDLKPVESVSSPSERDRLQREIEAIPPGERGVSFFSGRPMPASELTPVSMVVGGHKRTVMATRDEAAAIGRGETPAVRAFPDGPGRYTPWYEYRGYDPYRDYYGGWGGSGLGTLIDLYILTDLMGPAMWGGYGPWGYDGFGWGMPMPPVYMGGGPGFFGGYDGGGYDGGGGYAGDGGGFFDGGSGVAPDPEHTGGMDFFGQQDYADPGSGFDAGSGDSGGVFDSGGGFDFGGDSGGGGFDFGGGDSGGGFDFGGGGGDGF